MMVAKLNLKHAVGWWGKETVNNANGLTLTLSLEQARELTFLKNYPE